MTTDTKPAPLDLDEIDAAIGQANARWGHGEAQYDPDALALIDAATKLRAAVEFASYLEGDEDCLEGDCEHIGDRDQCPQVRVRVATGRDTIRLDAILEHLKRVDLDTEDTVDDLRHHLEMVQRYATGADE